MYHYRETIKSKWHTMMVQRKGLMTHRKSELKKLKLSYGGPSQRHASDTIQRIKALRQGRH